MSTRRSSQQPKTSSQKTRRRQPTTAATIFTTKLLQLVEKQWAQQQLALQPFNNTSMLFPGYENSLTNAFPFANLKFIYTLITNIKQHDNQWGMLVALYQIFETLFQKLCQYVATTYGQNQGKHESLPTNFSMMDMKYVFDLVHWSKDKQHGGGSLVGYCWAALLVLTHCMMSLSAFSQQQSAMSTVASWTSSDMIAAFVDAHSTSLEKIPSVYIHTLSNNTILFDYDGFQMCVKQAYGYLNWNCVSIDAIQHSVAADQINDKFTNSANFVNILTQEYKMEEMKFWEKLLQKYELPVNTATVAAIKAKIPMQQIFEATFYGPHMKHLLTPIQSTNKWFEKYKHTMYTLLVNQIYFPDYSGFHGNVVRYEINANEFDRDFKGLFLLYKFDNYEFYNDGNAFICAQKIDNNKYSVAKIDLNTLGTSGKLRFNFKDNWDWIKTQFKNEIGSRLSRGKPVNPNGGDILQPIFDHLTNLKFDGNVSLPEDATIISNPNANCVFYYKDGEIYMRKNTEGISTFQITKDMWLAAIEASISPLFSHINTLYTLAITPPVPLPHLEDVNQQQPGATSTNTDENTEETLRANSRNPDENMEETLRANSRNPEENHLSGEQEEPTKQMPPDYTKLAFAIVAWASAMAAQSITTPPESSPELPPASSPESLPALLPPKRDEANNEIAVVNSVDWTLLAGSAVTLTNNMWLNFTNFDFTHFAYFKDSSMPATMLTNVMLTLKNNVYETSMDIIKLYYGRISIPMRYIRSSTDDMQILFKKWCIAALLLGVYKTVVSNNKKLLGIGSINKDDGDNNKKLKTNKWADIKGRVADIKANLLAAINPSGFDT